MPADDPEDLDPGLARGRTRLAWIRTALAFGALAAVAVKSNLLAGLAVLAMTPLVWAAGHLASRTSRPAELSRRLLLVTVTVIAVAVVAAAVAIFGRGPQSLTSLLPRHG